MSSVTFLEYRHQSFGEELVRYPAGYQVSTSLLSAVAYANLIGGKHGIVAVRRHEDKPSDVDVWLSVAGVGVVGKLTERTDPRTGEAVTSCMILRKSGRARVVSRHHLMARFAATVRKAV